MHCCALAVAWGGWCLHLLPVLGVAALFYPTQSLAVKHIRRLFTFKTLNENSLVTCDFHPSSIIII